MRKVFFRLAGSLGTSLRFCEAVQVVGSVGCVALPVFCLVSLVSVRSDAEAAMDDIGDARDWDAQVHRHSVHAQAESGHELLAENLSWTYWLEFLCHSVLLVIINNLNFIGVPVPPFKAEAPLKVDADAVLALAIRSLFNRSNRFPGSAERVRISGAASSMSSLRRAPALDGPEPSHSLCG
jgi:hypothetical protein